MIANTVHLSPAEATQWRDLANQANTGVELASVSKAMELAKMLPPRLRNVPGQMRVGPDSKGMALIRNVPLEEAVSVPTPDNLSVGCSTPVQSGIEHLMLVLAGALGTPFSFASQQAGRLVLDIFPLRGHENGQLGSSSKSMLEWHAEHAFHPRRANYLLFLCIRNDQRAATRYAFAAQLRLPSDVMEELRRPQFTILPDESHSEVYNAAMDGARIESEDFANIKTLASELPRGPVLEGADDLLISVDFPYMPSKLHSRAANAALLSLHGAIEEAAVSVVLEPGDLLVLDNRRGVHARSRFAPRYDGTDRWLKQLSVGANRPGSFVNEYELRVR